MKKISPSGNAKPISMKFLLSVQLNRDPAPKLAHLNRNDDITEICIKDYRSDQKSKSVVEYVEADGGLLAALEVP